MVSWSANDAGVDPLVLVVQFSADGGSIWRTLQTDWTGTSVEIDRAALAGTTLWSLTHWAPVPAARGRLIDVQAAPRRAGIRARR